MTRIDLLEDEEEELFSDNSASCNTTDEVEESPAEADKETGESDLIAAFHQEQIDFEAAEEYYRYCQYYHRHVNPADENNYDTDDHYQDDSIDSELNQSEERRRQQLVASVLSYIYRLVDTMKDNQNNSIVHDSERSNLELRPKFAILKHRPEILHSSNSDSSRNRDTNKRTPEWYLNMPDTLTPFPDFSSKVDEQEH